MSMCVFLDFKLFLFALTVFALHVFVCRAVVIYAFHCLLWCVEWSRLVSCYLSIF